MRAQINRKNRIKEHVIGTNVKENIGKYDVEGSTIKGQINKYVNW